MASESDYEDGEILEEGQEVEPATVSTAAPVPNVSVSPAPVGVPTTSQTSLQPPHEPLPAAHHPSGDALLPTPGSNPRKRLHSSLPVPRAADSATVYDNRTPLTHRQPARYNIGNGYSRRDATPYEHQDDRVYAEDLIIKHPRQQPRSHVLLDFATWMGAARSRKRLDVEDVQKLVLNVLRGGSRKEKGVVSPYLLPSLMPEAELPTKVCVVLLGRMHPSVLQKYRAKLSFFDGCSSVPVMLTKQELNQIRKTEAPLPEIMYKFPRPTVDTHELSADELFYAHELTFLMKHSAGFTDELVFVPEGKFTRKSQPMGGTWELDGDLLHLKWRQRTSKPTTEETPTEQDAVMEEEEDDAYTLDVLVSDDGSMHEFRTDAVTDETYAHKVPEHLAKKRRGDDKPRSIWLSLAKAVAVDVPRSADGTLVLKNKTHTNGSSKETSLTTATETNGEDAKKEEDPSTPEAFASYTLSPEELKQHGYPIDVEEEQRQLLEATNGSTRDRYAATKPRPALAVETPASASDDEEGEAMETDETVTSAPSSSGFIYALDCEMCETDIGMELTRVTVVNIKGAVVYDQLVKPQSAIINYHTEFSGISEETLRDTKYILADVQRDLTTRFLFSDTILVGHSLTSDLRAMRLVHPTIADTAILYPHQRGFPFRTSLKYLTKTYLKKDIQMQIQAGHDSAEDAIASLELLLLKVREGPWFGIPAAVSSSGAFDSIVDKVFALEKKMAMLRLQSSTEPERKPWDLYASGDHKAHSQSPFRHARAVKANGEANASNSSGSAIVKVEDCSSWETLKTSIAEALGTESSDSSGQPDLCWVEIEPPSASAAACNTFVAKHEVWMAEQQAHCEQVDAFLQQVRDEVLPKGTLLLALPQGDLSLLRYLKGLRTRSKWRDATPSRDDMAPEELHAAVGDAFRGVMDGCLFLMQK
ncbi:putative exonuclease [Phytophthora ramorum]|uniref:putative exonuclease n=1 Tax=Phytophthora ramorum TaxID=164328 RepID=UPI00309DAD02|nr:putative exonuclease [Phytophthora ramorum]